MNEKQRIPEQESTSFREFGAGKPPVMENGD